MGLLCDGPPADGSFGPPFQINLSFDKTSDNKGETVRNAGENPLKSEGDVQIPGGSSEGLKPEDVNPRLVFHYGIPSGSLLLAYDSIQTIFAISTKDGRIKLFGKDNTQALLVAAETVSSKFLQFIENQGILLHVNANNHIEASHLTNIIDEVWDIERRLLSYVHILKEEITSFTVLPRSLYMYLGDSVGNISVLQLNKETCNIVQMKYRIPSSASHGDFIEVAGHTAVMHILPQPTAENKRVLIVYRDGFITLWSIQDSKAIFTTGGIMLQTRSYETKEVTAACWACPFGSKVAVGYSSGEISIWGVPSASNIKTEVENDKELRNIQNAPICKLNLGYKLDKIPIATMKWAYADGKASRLYVLGSADYATANLLQVIIISEHTESRTIKLGLHPPEPCVDMEIISSSYEQSKHKQDSFLLLGKSGHVYAYDDSNIEKYLLQSQSRSPPSLPKEVMVRLPFVDSAITTEKFVTDNPYQLSSADKEYFLMQKNIPPLFTLDVTQRDGTCSNSTHFSTFSNFKNLYITGHSNGAINFWDLSCPLFFPIISLTQQSENDSSLSGIPLTALHFDINSRLLISGDQIGTVRIFKLKPEPYGTESSFMSFQGFFLTYLFLFLGSSKKGSNHIIHNLKVLKVNGAVLSIKASYSSKHLAVGSDQGYVSLIDMEGPTLLYEKHIASELSSAVIALQFETCSFHGFEKNVIVVATKDSSVLALESDTGNMLSSCMVHPKKPSKALFMQILDTSGGGPKTGAGLESSKGNPVDDGIPKQLLLLLCSEKAVYLYSLTHVVQGVKKVYYKKKFHSSYCCWASTFDTPSDSGLVLLFSSGKIEIRSLPELSLLRETSIGGLIFSSSKMNGISDKSICSSRDGEIIVVNLGSSHLDSIFQVYKKDLMVSQGLISEPVVHKEKKKGMFSSVIKDIKGSKAYPGPYTEAEDARESFEELSTIFAVANFPLDEESGEDFTIATNEAELDIDDIDVEDVGEKKPKGNPMVAALNKQKLSSKLKQMSVKNEKTPAKEEPQDEKAGTVDQIRRKYGYGSSSEPSAVKMAESKLHANLRKLQVIGMKTTEMQDTAQSFSSMAKEVLRSTERISRPDFGMGMVAKTGMLDSRTFNTAGKNEELYSSILPTSSMMKRSVPSLT
ncbi:hypothetical protein RJ640_027799 [Escallonia rubra]|uniref:Lethal giant larvae (Lgl)-like C-terminal domain-containing protein n=1 Tax=Escallonia rubra TaxID=112253 RepID=A0AA88U1J4_9ASTE|nr:hypothetical protein RJ640_027799 [Escallonia rubra]